MALHELCRLRFFPEFIQADECEHMYEELFHELPWRQQEDKRNGQCYLQPRLTAWISEYPYSYAGVTHQANPNVCTSYILSLCKQYNQIVFTFRNYLICEDVEGRLIHKVAVL